MEWLVVWRGDLVKFERRWWSLVKKLLAFVHLPAKELKEKFIKMDDQVVLAPEKGAEDDRLLSTVENPLHQNLSTNEIRVVEESSNTKEEANSRGHETTEWARDIFQLSGGSNKELIAKQQNIGRTVIVLLFVLGFAAGLINGVILLTNAALCSFQAKLVVQGGYFGIGLLYFLLTMISSVAVACLVCRYGAREAAGSGLPEFKYLLASEMKRGDYDRLVSRRIFVFKVIGLILSVGGGLSVGSEGPLVHTAACIAHLLMKYVIWFDEVSIHICLHCQHTTLNHLSHTL